ncbi:MAG: 5-formyltetrahydrofolate cyclo-ligase [Chthoniobacteraceae bacterium]
MRSKTEIRRDISAILRTTPDVRAEKSARLCAAIAESAAWRDARTVAIFAPQPREPDVELLWMLGDGKAFAYPRVTEDRLDLFRVASLHELAPGTFGVREPVADIAHAVAPETLGLILVPGVAFTADGARLGRGGGFYDRLLAWLAPHTSKIGVCFDSQILHELPVEAHDQHVDFIATESGLLSVA